MRLPARYLYPRAYLSAASAALLGPTRDGRLFLSARRKQRTRIRGLEVIQNEAPKHPSIAPAVIADSMGEFPVNVSSIRRDSPARHRRPEEGSCSPRSGMRRCQRSGDRKAEEKDRLESRPRTGAPTAIENEPNPTVHSSLPGPAAAGRDAEPAGDFLLTFRQDREYPLSVCHYRFSGLEFNACCPC